MVQLLTTNSEEATVSDLLDGANIFSIPYAKKRPKYKADSMFISARRFAEQFDDWTPIALAKRGKAIAQWAVKRWPY